MMDFEKNRKAYSERMARTMRYRIGGGKFVAPEQTAELLTDLLRCGDRVCLEGDNQKQADFLARELAKLDPARVNCLHLVQSSLVLPEHLDLFRKGIADRVDFAFSGPQSKALYELAKARRVKIGAIHTYLELYARYFMDLCPQVSLVAAELCDEAGNLFTGFNTEDTPLICEATRFRHGVVLAQVRKKVGRLPRVDIPACQVDYIVETGKSAFMEPLFTRDPASITDLQILMAMMILKGIYEPYGVRRLNHGLGFATAAVELLLPTYGAELGMKGRCCTHWILNPVPTLIPAIEAGFVEHIHMFGGEPGMEDYVRARSDVFGGGPEGEPRSNRCTAHMSGLYAVDLFCGATLQVDKFGNSSTAIKGMIAGFGGAPNLGGTPPGRRHMTDAYRKAGTVRDGIFHGRKLVVQVAPTVSEKKKIPVFVDELDAMAMAAEGLFDVAPVMIAGEQLTHLVTEAGIAVLHACPDVETRMQAIAAIAGDTPVGRTAKPDISNKLRRAGILRTADDLGVDRARANASLLAAHNLEDLEKASGGLYRIPDSLR
ncbi:MAG: malonate decarboxylase subunit alpha [Verrucomicrobia bacterium]|nr:malonate decarboxylase subunit alpha [Verrucomicrobiota bacterium]